MKLRTDLLDWNLDLQNKKLTGFDDEINALESIDKLERSKIDLLQRQIALAQQRQILENVQNEKDTKIFFDGKFNLVANPLKVIEEKKKLAQMELENSQQNKEDILNVKKEQLNDEKEIWNRSRTSTQRSLEDDTRMLSLEYEDMDKLVNNNLIALYNTFDGNWNAILANLSSKVDVAKRLSEQIAGYSSGIINQPGGANYNNGLGNNSSTKTVINQPGG